MLKTIIAFLYLMTILTNLVIYKFVKVSVTCYFLLQNQKIFDYYCTVFCFYFATFMFAKEYEYLLNYLLNMFCIFYELF